MNLRVAERLGVGGLERRHGQQDGDDADDGDAPQPTPVLALRRASRRRIPITRWRVWWGWGPVGPLGTHLTSLFGRFRRTVTTPTCRSPASGGASNVLPMTEIDPDEARPRVEARPPCRPGRLLRDSFPRTRSESGAIPPAAQWYGAPRCSRPGVTGGLCLPRPARRSRPPTKSAAWRWLFYALLGFVVGPGRRRPSSAIVAGDVAGKNAAQMAAITSAERASRVVRPLDPGRPVGRVLRRALVGQLDPGAPGICGPTSGCASAGSTSGGSPSGSAGRSSSHCSTRPSSTTSTTSTAVAEADGRRARGGIPAGGAGHGDPGPLHGGAVLPGAALQVSGSPLHARTAWRTTRARGAGIVLAVVVDGLLFGLAHGEWVQLAGLALFGVALAAISYRTGRLGHEHGGARLLQPRRHSGDSGSTGRCSTDQHGRESPHGRGTSTGRPSRQPPTVVVRCRPRGGCPRWPPSCASSR